jgi:hypothetical protein
MSILPFFVEPFSLSQAVMDHVHVLLGRGDTPFRLLLEGVQDVDRLRIADGIDSTPRVPDVIRDNLNDRPSTKTFQRLYRWIGFTLLRGIQSLADDSPNLTRKTAKVSSA